jgi:hypothetical protein
MIPAEWLEHAIATINHDRKKEQEALTKVETAEDLTEAKKKQEVDQVKVSDCYQFLECYSFV